MKNDYQEAWTVSEGKYDGHRITVRKNVGARSLCGDAAYPFRLGIAIPFLDPQKDGMPLKGENEIYNRIEDLICDYFEPHNSGVLCLVLTTQGMKEFILYTNTDKLVDLIGSLKIHFSEYDIQHYVEQDTEWEVYGQWK
ncbi:MAG TPA: DUF695 domain-containing protein [Candidatus Saccharimonadales bacterium]|nr:DUF695 domain-containing protein [Candidatus Saccharimonadales bacterium]